MSKQQIDDSWTQWSEQFMQANSVFAALYGSSASGSIAPGETGRMQIMDDLGSAIQDHPAPQNAQTAALTESYNSWVYWQQLTGSFGNPNQPTTTAQQTDSIDQQYAQWLQSFVQANPGVQPLVDRAIRPDLTSTLNTMAAQGVDVSI
jgi:hypothetical protein